MVRRSAIGATAGAARRYRLDAAGSGSARAASVALPMDEEQKRRISARLGPVVRAVAQDTRSQTRNRELALERLAGRLESALHVPRPRRSTGPTAGSRRRRLEGKRHTAEKKSARRGTGD